MSTQAIEPRVGFASHVPVTARRQLPWLVGGLVGGFLVPFVFADRLNLPKDLYYAIFGAAVIGFFLAWARATSQLLAEMLRRHWRLAVLLGLVCGGLLAFIVLQQAATTRPAGIALAGAVLWRGLFYGAIDGLLLSSFPILAVFAAFQGTPLDKHRRGKFAIGALALASSMAMTATYHLGYSDFRSAMVRSPLAGDVVWSTPTLLTLNPIGAPVAHMTLHTTAVLHSYHTDLFLPPHR